MSQQHDYLRKSSIVGVEWSIVQSVFQSFVDEHTPEAGKEEAVSFDMNTIISAESESLKERLERVQSYNDRMGADLSSAPAGHAFLNGRHMELGDVRAFVLLLPYQCNLQLQDFLRLIQGELMEQLRYLQEKVSATSTAIHVCAPTYTCQIYSGEISDNDAEQIDNYFYDLPQSSSRRSRYVHLNQQSNSVLMISLPDVFNKVGYLPPASAYLYPSKRLLFCPI